MLIIGEQRCNSDVCQPAMCTDITPNFVRMCFAETTRVLKFGASNGAASGVVGMSEQIFPFRVCIQCALFADSHAVPAGMTIATRRRFASTRRIASSTASRSLATSSERKRKTT
jgi:hypothetical protein